VHAHTCGQVITVFSDSRDHHYSPSTLICGDWAASATLCSCALVDDDCLRLILFRPVIRESKGARRKFDEKFSEDVSTMMQVGVGCSLVTRSAPQLPQVLDMQGDESRRPIVENTLRVRRACCSFEKSGCWLVTRVCPCTGVRRRRRTCYEQD